MSDTDRSAPLLIILSSPSGAGKSTLARRLLETRPDIQFSISATTRAPRPGEEDGREYYFRTREEFDRIVAEGGMLEHATVFGNSYGTPRAPIEDALAEGRDVIFDVDWQGGQQIRASDLARNLVSIFILPPSIAELERRLKARGQDSEDVVERRMAQAWDEISHWPEFDYVLVNDDLDACFARIETILAAERLRRVRAAGLLERVTALQAEFQKRINPPES